MVLCVKYVIAKRILALFYPRILSDPYLLLANAQDHLAQRIVGTGCFRETGSVTREDREALHILECLIRGQL